MCASFSLEASAGAILYKKEKQSVRIQADVINLTDRLNVITRAVREKRPAKLTFSFRLQTDF